MTITTTEAKPTPYMDLLATFPADWKMPPNGRHRPGRMNPVVKEAWCNALLSGEFPQSRGHLHDRKGYCCLGVLAELAYRHGFVDRVTHDDANGVYRYDGENNFPSTTVWHEFAGLEKCDPDVFYGTGVVSLACLNDNGVSFKEIARTIQDQL